MLPRLVRLKDAPLYLALDKNFFNREIRALLTDIHLGRAVLFDREELDIWVEHAKKEYGRPPYRTPPNAKPSGTRQQQEEPGTTMRDLAKRLKEERRRSSPD